MRYVIEVMGYGTKMMKTFLARLKKDSAKRHVDGHFARSQRIANERLLIGGRAGAPCLSLKPRTLRDVALIHSNATRLVRK